MTSAIGVALPADGAIAHLLIDRASELARTLNARWVAFVVCNPIVTEESLCQAELAMRRGGTVFVCEGDDVAQTLIALACREKVDVLMLGAPKSAGILRRIRRGVIDRVLQATRTFDVVVIGNA